MNVASKILITCLLSMLLISCGEKSMLSSNVSSGAFNNKDFALTPPREWVADHDSGSFGWEDFKSMQEIRISVLQIEPGNDIPKATEGYFAIRKKSLEAMSESMSISDPITSVAPDGVVSYRYRVEDQKNDVRMCMILRGNARRMVSFTYLKYAPQLSFDAVDTKCDELIASLVIH